MRVIAALLFMISVLPSVRAAEWHDVEYGKVGSVSLKMDGRAPDGKGPFPAAILVHGGGWVRGDRAYIHVEPLFEPLTQAGIAWFSIDYRLATDFFLFGAAVEDVRMAVRHLREHAREYNIDPDRIALIGESAGAHLASLAAFADPKSVAAVVAFYCPTDLVELATNSTAVPAQIRDALANSQFRPLLLNHLQALSPVQKVRADAPPFLLIHGTADRIVPYDQSVRLLTKMHAAGASCELVPVKGGGHGMYFWDRSAQAAYRGQMIAWLHTHLVTREPQVRAS